MPDARVNNSTVADELEAQIANLRVNATAILDRATADGDRKLTADEAASYERIDSEMDALIARQQKEQQRLASQQRRTSVIAPPRGDDGAAMSIEFPGDGDIPGMRLGRPSRNITINPGETMHRLGSADYRKAFNRYLSSGGRQSLGLQVGKDTKGGYWAPIQFVTDLIKFLDNNVFMRQLCNVLPPMPSAVNIGIPTWDTDPGDADWTAEVPASDISEDNTATVGKREMMPHLLTKLVLVSRKLMRTSIIDPLNFLRDRLGYKFAVTEEQAFLTGDGAQQPLGVFVANANGVPTTRDVTCASTTVFTADEVINLLFGLKEQYQRNATGLFSREFIKRARKLKDGNSQYLWMPGLGGTPGTILDRPYVMSEYVPSTYTTGLYIGMFADFKAGYWIADSLSMELEDISVLYSRTNQAGVIARKETDGAPVLAEAFSRLILA